MADIVFQIIKLAESLMLMAIDTPVQHTTNRDRS